jgi:DNA-binding transcriptional ArsR family regulator
LDLEEDTYTVIFSSLKHPIRRKILRILNESSLTYTELLKSLGVETGVLNYHLDSLRELLMKSDDRYGLSEHGQAAINLIANVEEPLKKQREEIRLFGHRLKPTTILVVSFILLLSSNTIWFYSFVQVSDINRTTLIWALSDSMDSIHESIVALNTSVTRGYLDYSILFAVADYSTRLGNQLETLSRVDKANAEKWLNIGRSADSLRDFCKDFGTGIYVKFIHTDALPYINLTWVYNPKIEAIIHDLEIIEGGLSNNKGPSPEAEIAADQLVKDLERARLTFNIPKKYLR